MRKENLKKVIYWVSTGLVAFIFLGSASGKFAAHEESLKMASAFGLDARTYFMVGVVEVACLLLFVIPRTGVMGTLLLTAYMGGAIATHLEHGLSIVAPCVVQAIMLTVAFYRFPELRTRLQNTKP